MKTRKVMRYRLMAVCGMILTFLSLSSNTFAYDVEIGGIYYNLDSNAKTAEVTYNYNDSYSGIINIPSSITYNGINYIVKSIGASAFYNCDGLSKVSIPHSVSLIGSSAFSGCSGLTSIIIPSSVTIIKGNPFWNCVNLSKIDVESSNSIYDSRDNCNAIINTSTNELTTGCNSTIIPQSVKSIGSSAFALCKNLTSVTIPNSVISIGSHAFWGCEGIKSIKIPRNVISIGTSAFIECSNLANIVVESGNTVYDSRDNCNAIIKTSTNELVVGCLSTVIPNSVLYIGDGAFAGHTGLTTISIPSSVISIGNAAFSLCEGLNSLTISNGVTIIGKNAFQYCSSIKSITIPNSVTTIDDEAFYQCEGLTSIIIPSSITYLGKNPFTRCSSLASISVEHGNLLYDSRDNCNAIINTATNMLISGCSSTVIPNGIIAIGNDAFYWCYGLSSITIPNSVTSIGDQAFRTCRSLTSITIPKSITGIGYAAFVECYKLESVNCNIENPFDVNAFNHVASKLQVPKGTKSKYQALPGWANYFKEIVEEQASYTLSIKATGNGSASYNNTTIRNKTSEFTVNEGSSATISFTPDAGYKIKSVMVGSSDVTSKVSNNQYTVSNITANTTVNVEFDVITHKLSIKSTGFGTASYNNTTIRNKTSEFTVNEGSSATISFTPDTGCRIKSVKVGSSDVTSKVSNNQYTISNITANKTVEVEFEEITHTLSIKASGNGSASYNNTTVRNKTSEFTVNEGNSATITFTPDTGCKIKSVKVGSSDVTSKLSNNQYTISNIAANTTVEVEFEAITHTLSIKASGNGSASYNNTTVRNKTSEFTVNEGISATISFTPDAGYKIKSVKVGSSDVTSKVSNNEYTISNISADTMVEVVFEAITHNLSIKATGNGSALYSSTTIRNTTETFTVDEGTSATIMFSPDEGYRIKSVKVGTTDVTSSVSNNQYTISKIASDTSAEVEFEAIPIVISTYNLTIKATGNGSASYNNTTVRNTTETFTVNEGTSTTITFTPDEGYRIKSVKVGTTNVTSSVSNNQYTVSNIASDTMVEVVFEAKTYTLSITASGNGYATFDNTKIRNTTKTFTLSHSNTQTIPFTPDTGYRIKSLKVNGSIVNVSNNQYTVSNISADTTVEVEFEAIPSATYSLTIKATGNGSASYNNTAIRNTTETFTVDEGTAATITFTQDDGYRIREVKVNGSTVSISNDHYTISSIRQNTTVEVEFVEKINGFESGGINYSVLSESERTVNVAAGNYGIVLEVPAMVSYREENWTVTGIDNGALSANTELAAIIWNPDAAFTENVDNPNLLLYVKSASYAPVLIKNVIVNGTANSIVLSEATGKNDFYCPQEFTAMTISYTHNYKMETGLGSARGWETIALPFDVQKVSHQSKGEIVPFANWKSGDANKPFWLMTYGNNGWTEANSIKANTPYIISMPNHSYYKPESRLSGNVTFSAENVTIPTSGNIRTVNYNGRTFIPNYMNQNEKNYYALNVNNDYVTYSGNDVEGSKFFIGLRAVHPFEAYMISASQTRSYIAIDDDMTTGIGDITEIMADEKTVRVYNLNGQLIMVEGNKRLDEIKPLLSAGVYIVNGKKIIIR